MFFDGGSLGKWSISPPPLNLSGGTHALRVRPREGGTNLFYYIAAFCFDTAMHITVTIPAIRTVVTPVEGVDTREDQIEAPPCAFRWKHVDHCAAR